MSKIRLHGSSSGYMEIAPPAAASSATVTLPNSAGEVLLSDGSAASLTQIPAANIVGIATAGFGNGILQVAQAVKTDTFSRNETSFADITGLSTSITPSSSNNKVLVDVRVYLSAGHATGTTTAKLNIVRGSTDIGQPDGSPTHKATIHNWNSYSYMQVATMNFLDEPATTSATTYKIQLGTDGTAAEIFVNRYFGSDDYHGISTITLMEVAA